MSEDTQKETTERGLRKERVGTVVSAKQDKTLVVQIDRRTAHPLYKKVVTSSKKYYVHDEENKANNGDVVRIVETRPLSKLKRWRLVEIVRKAEG
jgi:small subunit ribosomal protein S17